MTVLVLAAASAAAQPAPYAADPGDAWNRIFRALFTRDVLARVNGRTSVRHESGDRPIAPLYPSFFSSAGVDSLLRQPRAGQLERALREALQETAERPPLQRALMQSDLWAAYDVLSAAQRNELLPLLARLIHKVALTPAEIRGLPDNYEAAVRLGAPPLYDPGSGWIEVEWRPERSHDHDAAMRTVSRVFLKPRTPPLDVAAFVNRFRSSAASIMELEATALVTEPLLIARDGSIVRSPLTIDIQVRHFAGDRVIVEEFELSRQKLREEPRFGGFVHEGEDFAAYLAAAANDYRFASPAVFGERRGRPVLATLAARCQSCHGPGLGAIVTFNQMFPERLPPVKVLPPSEDRHAAFVAARKREGEDFRTLLRSW
jgi:hypothetical protein